MSGMAIVGYRQLTAADVALINEGNALAEQVGEYVQRLRDTGADLTDQNTGDTAWGGTLDQRWISIGATHLQQGFMALTRAIAKPESF